MQAYSGTNNTGFIHRLDARTKMAVAAGVSIVVVCLKEPLPLALIGIMGFFFLLSTGRFRLMALAYLFIGLMLITAAGCAIPIIKLLKGSDASYADFLVPFLRIIATMNVVLAMALSNRIQGMLSALKSLRLPLFIYLPTSATIRFIPVFMEDVRQIRESLKIRGFHIGVKSLFLHPILTLRLMFAPLVIRALRSADDLGMAAELKGIGLTTSSTHHNPTRLGFRDAFTLLFWVLLLGLSLGIEFGPLKEMLP
ncbi:energy-coupling factor transporter transmembrane protein EcfT [Desulfoluna sp.]|uniref:energy-coupling factor transporter transmembrane component T family protein n=1 Tax=Desulfoluna sp. TaxID=2045199 RepID=UPI0026260497|nr:energy-coupling factor transporter transmembrane component T [Desulfoluna sp.]